MTVFDICILIIFTQFEFVFYLYFLVKFQSINAIFVFTIFLDAYILSQ